MAAVELLRDGDPTLHDAVRFAGNAWPITGADR